MPTKKTLIIRTTSEQDVTEYSDEYIAAMQTILKFQAKTMDNIVDVAFEVRTEEEDTETTQIDNARAERLLSLVRSEFTAFDTDGETSQESSETSDEQH